MKVGACTFWLIVAGCASGHGLAWADTLYSFVDEQGKTHFSNLPQHGKYVALELDGGVPDRKVLQHIVLREARILQLDPMLIEAVISVESDWDVAALSERGAKGLMQLMPVVAKHYLVENPFDPRQNVRGGVGYFSDLYKKYRDLNLSLAAYNAGETVVDEYRPELPPYQETREYVRKVKHLYQSLLLKNQ